MKFGVILVSISSSSQLWHITTTDDSSPQLIGIARLTLFDTLQAEPIRYDVVTRMLDTICPLKTFNEDQDVFRTICNLHLIVSIEDFGPIDPTGDPPDGFSPQLTFSLI